MYRVKLADLQKCFPAVVEADNFQVVYANFTLQVEFGLLFKWSYRVIIVSPYKITASIKLNDYLSAKDVTDSCMVWITEKDKDTLVTKYYVDSNIFIKVDN